MTEARKLQALAEILEDAGAFGYARLLRRLSWGER